MGREVHAVHGCCGRSAYITSRCHVGVPWRLGIVVKIQGHCRGTMASWHCGEDSGPLSGYYGVVAPDWTSNAPGT
eukprot:121275-Chlamydomonas_euryale.AAC.1